MFVLCWFVVLCWLISSSNIIIESSDRPSDNKTTVTRSKTIHWHSPPLDTVCWFSLPNVIKYQTKYEWTIQSHIMSKRRRHSLISICFGMVISNQSVRLLLRKTHVQHTIESLRVFTCSETLHVPVFERGVWECSCVHFRVGDTIGILILHASWVGEVRWIFSNIDEWYRIRTQHKETGHVWKVIRIPYHCELQKVHHQAMTWWSSLQRDRSWTIPCWHDHDLFSIREVMSTRDAEPMRTCVRALVWLVIIIRALIFHSHVIETWKKSEIIFHVNSWVLGSIDILELIDILEHTWGRLRHRYSVSESLFLKKYPLSSMWNL